MLVGPKLMLVVAEEYRKWTKDSSEDRSTWAKFEEFLIHYYIRMSLEVDAFLRALAMPVSQVEGKIDRSMGKLMNMLKLANCNSAEKLELLVAIYKMPVPHVLNKKVASRSEPMDMDALAGSDEDSVQVDALLKRGSRRSAKPAKQKTSDKLRVSCMPGYKIFKDWVMREVYDQHVMDNMCLGCGKGHHWTKCSNYPKGQQK
ncbi:hypothetical protein GGI21_004644 [Coemansia aciculifera]|nr:hypothetical protein GGI21_004644 [Coemansia aciculifera]